MLESTTTASEETALAIDQLPILTALHMYDLLPDIIFWVKDADGRVIHANQSLLDHIGVDSLEQIIGMTDFDFAPLHIAKQFIADDQRVMHGDSVTDRLELNMPEKGEISWFTTSKRPLLNASGAIVGSYGISRQLEKTAVALNAMVGAFMGFAVFLSDDQQLRDINFWMLGSLASAHWSIMVPVIICAVIPLVFIYSQARTLNAFLLGEREAHYLGFNVEKSKRLLLFLAAALTGGIVAFAGMIGFVGLVVPHIVRMLIGPDHRWLLPNAMILGALLMVLADLFARTMVVPAELPLGVVTSALGAPFFIWLLSSGKARISG